jgi:hypothetical protein
MSYIIADGLQTITKPLKRGRQVCKKGWEMILAKRSARIGKQFYCPSHNTQFWHCPFTFILEQSHWQMLGEISNANIFLHISALPHFENASLFFKYIHTYIHTYIRTYTYTHTHKQTHTDIHISWIHHLCNDSLNMKFVINNIGLWYTISS